MNILYRYLFRIIFGMTGLMTLIFTGVQLFIGLLSDMGDLGQRGYQLLDSLHFVLLNLPLNVYVMFPNIALLGTLLALGSLASHSELTILRVSGLSIAQIARMVLTTAVVIVFFASAIGEALAPNLSSYAQKVKLSVQTQGQLFSNQHGIWLRQNNQFIHIGTNYGGLHLSDVTRYELDSQFRLKTIRHAKSGDFIDGHWHMKQIEISHLGFDKVTASSQESEIWDLNEALKMIGKSDPTTLTLPQLYEQAKLGQENGLNTAELWLIFWNRILQPVTTLMMVFLAIPFVFGPLRSTSLGMRLLTGVMIGLALFIFNRFFGPFSLVYQFPPFLSALIPLAAFFILAIILFFKQQ